jgi:Zn-dependent protease with chaperone function
MRPGWLRNGLAAAVTLALAGCAVGTAQPTGGPPPQAGAPRAGTRTVDPALAARLKNVMVPLIGAMNHPLPLNQVRVGMVEDPQINAANAGAGEFYVTTGLLERANDEELRGVMAHEIAHADLGHVAKAQVLGTGLNIGMILLEQIFPGSSAITPLAGTLLARGYGRNEEYEADSHGVAILQRAGYDGKRIMVDTLSWLEATAGPGSGGFFSTHPAAGDRIQAIAEKNSFK